MKISAVTSLALLAGTTHGFTTVHSPSSYGVVSSKLSMSDAVVEPVADEEQEVQVPDAPPAELSGLRMRDVRKAVANLEKDNFDVTLENIEGFLTNEAGSALYSKSMRRMEVRAKALGLEIPEGYAKEAKATQKRREKQNAFIQQKEEERLAAEAAPAEESEEAAEGTDASPAEETA